MAGLSGVRDRVGVSISDQQRYQGLLQEALANDGWFYVWSGDWRRNEDLRNCLDFGVESGLIELEEVESDQETGWIVRKVEQKGNGNGC